MASLTFKKRDNQRFKKTYSTFRRRPNEETIPVGNFLLEVASLDLSGQTTITYNFETSFPSTPVVTATAVDSAGNNEANVNVYIVSLSSTSVTFGLSKSFTGQIHLHASVVG